MNPIIERQIEEQLSISPVLERIGRSIDLARLVRGLRTAGIEITLEHLFGSTEYQVVDYHYQRRRIDRYEEEYFSHPDGGYGRIEGWIPGKPFPGNLIERKVILTFRRKNIQGGDPYVP